MLKILSQFGSKFKASRRPERIDASRIYAKVMKQARNPVFYVPGLVEDTTDGRMEWLTAHLSILLCALQKHGEDGAKLGQAIYDTMVDDFDIALREEGLSDSGVKHRIKPLAKMFLSRARVYAKELTKPSASLQGLIQTYILHSDEESKHGSALNKYCVSFYQNLEKLGLDEIADAQFEFPAFRSQ